METEASEAVRSDPAGAPLASVANSPPLDAGELDEAGIPELTPLGKRIEMLRLERRLTKRALAKRADISRQQLWRVMTGKSELTDSLCARLADALDADSRSLAALGEPHGLPARPGESVGRAHPAPDTLPTSSARDLAEYILERHGLERTLATMPADGDGRYLKRALLNAIEDLATGMGLELPAHFFDLRREVVNGER